VQRRRGRPPDKELRGHRRVNVLAFADRDQRDARKRWLPRGTHGRSARRAAPLPALVAAGPRTSKSCDDQVRARAQRVIAPR
jgi:hypothetical protein